MEITLTQTSGPVYLTEPGGTIHWGQNAIHYQWYPAGVGIGSGQPNAVQFTTWQEWHDKLIELGVPEQQIPHSGTPSEYVQPASADEAYPVDATATYAARTWVLQGEDNLQPPADDETSPWEPVKIVEPPQSFDPWSQPAGAHDAYRRNTYVAHNGKNWLATVDYNVWEPGIYGWAEYGAEPGPYPPIWVQPTGAHDAYAIGAHVEHTNANRTEIYWESLIAANTTVPGDDGVPPGGPWYDRYWQPLAEKPNPSA